MPTSRPPTPSATARRQASGDRGARRLRARLPLHARRSRSGSTPSGTLRGRRPRRVLRVRARADRPAARDRGRLRAGRGGPHRQPAGGARLRLRRRLGPLPPRGRRRHGRLRRLGPPTRAAAPSRSGGATSRRSPRAPRSGLFDIIAHPDLVKYWGPAHPGRPARRAICAATTSRRSRRSPRRASPSRSPRPGCASRSARSTPRPPSSRCAWKRARRSRSPATPTARGRRRRLRAGARAARASWGCGELCVFERRARRLEPIGAGAAPREECSDARGHRLRLPPPRAGPAAGPRRRARSPTSWASTVTPTPTCSPTP